MEHKGTVTIRFFSFLEAFRREQGLPASVEIAVPESGRKGLDLALELGIPPERIEAVFRNGLVQDLQDPVFPGDRVAFVPPGTPGPYRVLLGMVRKNTVRARREHEPTDKD
jgi:molybdopterin converting factor small subunit